MNIPEMLITSIIVLLAGLLSLASLRLWDKFSARLMLNKIVGTTEEDEKKLKALKKLALSFNFNHEENKKKLVAAGIYNNSIAQIYYLIKLVPLAACILTFLALFFFNAIVLTTMVIGVSLSAVTFLIIPDMYISMRAQKVTKKVSSRLPFLLDLMNICVQTGMTIESSLEYLSKELSTVDENLSYVVFKTVERSKVVGINKAIDEFYEMIPTREAMSFTMTLKQSLQYGSSVGPVLSSLAGDIREINIMELEEKIGKLGAKMSLPLIVFIMVPIVVLIAAPGILRMING